MTDQGHTPTTEEYREHFRQLAGDGVYRPELRKFDRWLADLIAEKERAAAEKAWDEGHRSHPYFGVNPYRKDGGD